MTDPPTMTDASGLTEAERQVLLDVAYAYANPFNDDNPTPEWEGLVATVERIVAERVRRVVEGERDAARVEHSEACATTDQFRDQQARAESAEAAHAALVADRDDAWRVAAQRRSEARRYYVAWQVARMRARSLRALLGGGAS